MQNYPMAGFGYMANMYQPNPYQAGMPFHQALSEGMTNDLSQRYMFRMRVEGKGSINAEPDIAEVVIGVITENRELKAAQEENARISAAVLRTLGNMGIPSEDIRTQSYNIFPQYDFIEGAQVFRGYRVVHTFRVIIRDIAKVGDIIDAAVDSGANTIENISFTVERPSEYYQTALKAAIDDALMKAQTIAGKLGVQILQYPIRINEVSRREITPVPFVSMQAAEASTPIQAGQIEITAQINAVFAYSPI